MATVIELLVNTNRGRFYVLKIKMKDHAWADEISVDIIDIKNDAWVVVNNDFWSRVRWLANDFHNWKSLANRIKSDQKSVFTVTNALFYFLYAYGNKCIVLFLVRYFMSWIHNAAKTNIDRSFRHCRKRRSLLT